MNNTGLLILRRSISVPNLGLSNLLIKRFVGNKTEEIKSQNILFDNELKRQRESVGRIEKIEVQCEEPSESISLVMNKNISTPFDCARHLGEKVVDRSVVALLNNDTLWHMHKPLPDSCTLQFLHYNMPQPSSVNKVFWRSGSFLLGAIAKNAFKDNVEVQLHSFPIPNVRSGSFVYDIQLSLEDWKPTQNELKVLSLEMIKFYQQAHPVEYLSVSTDLALDMFSNSTHKHQQIPDIAAHNNAKITLFRVGDHIDISKGPMVPNTNHFGRISIANVIKLNVDVPGGPIYRFQGVALPKSIMLNHFAYSLLEERARTLNSARLPGSHESYDEDHSFVSQVAM